MKVALVGNHPINGELFERCQARGHTVSTSERTHTGSAPDIGIVGFTSSNALPRDVFVSSELDAEFGFLRLVCCNFWSAGQFHHLIRSPRLIGFSLLSPLSDSSLVEIARPLTTAKADLEAARDLFASLGLEVIEVPDGPGLIAHRVLACLANEAISALAEGVADARTIDTAMKLGTNYPFGPLEWADRVGLEGILATMLGLYSLYTEDRYRPHALLRRLVQANMSIAEYERWTRGVS